MPNKSRSWTPERRQKQAELCRNNRPFRHSTGAKTKDGKVKSSQNALKSGEFSKDMMRLKSLLTKQRTQLERFLEMIY